LTEKVVNVMSVASRPIPGRGSLRALIVVGAVVLLIAVAAAVWAIGRGSGSPVVTRVRPVAPFTSVTLAGSNLVNVQVGSARSVIVHARADMLDHVTTVVRAGTLVIADAPGRANIEGPMRVWVTMPALTALTISPAGSGLLSVTGLHNNALTVMLSGSGLLRAAGSTTHLRVGLSGSGDLELGELTARDARVTVSGSGRAMVTATSNLAALVSGDGVIQYGGSPTHVTTSVTGSGTIIPG
jgi:Putative auto-transporter adhesin, head GIN domain